ncbi:MAG: class I SAM-dependent methyltransferase [Thermoproteaceae archaeon]|nr:class I SAM-dependent methyltransferase [Thermoproteaceae archaeon]
MRNRVAEYYDSIALFYESLYLGSEYYRTLYMKIGNVLDAYIKPRTRVLDVGAGTGFWSIYLRRRGAHVTSLDISCASLKRCKPCDERIQGDAASLPFKCESFDAVVALGSVYNHLPDTDAAFTSAACVLKRGGVFIADIDNAVCLDMFFEYAIYQGVRKLLAALIRGAVRGVWEFSGREVPFTYYSYFHVVSSMRRAGFKLVEARPVYLLPPLPSRLLQRGFRLKFFEKFDVLKCLAPLSTTVIYVAVRV